MSAPTVAGDGLDTHGEPWTFAGPVADGFDRHVARSVPLYEVTHRLVVDLAAHFLRPGGRLYDVGCSTGALLAALDDAHRARGAQLTGVDAEPDMARAARRRLAGRPGVHALHADARTHRWHRADVAVLHYTLQFLPPGDRPAVVAALHQALRPGGALLLFEKTLAPTPRLQDVTGQAYAEHKMAAGYTADEVTAKARSLRGVLEPVTSAANRAMLEEAGFLEVMTVHQHLMFEGVLAVKGGA